jgi:KDO2-lipid IV(A) lauroyltransferase
MRFVLNGIGKLIAWVAYFFGVREKVTRENITSAYPELSEHARRKITKGSYRNLGIVFAEMLYLRYAARKSIEKHIAVSNPDLFLDNLKEGQGLIVVAGHFANWEWLALGGALVLGKNFAVVRKNIRTSDKFLEKMRLRTGNTLINTADVRKMYKVLQEGKCLAILADQAAPGESTRVSFFGREVPTFEGPARLALRLRPKMLFAKCVRKHTGDYIIDFISIPFDDLTDESPENVKELTRRHTSLLEHAIRKHPDQWLWQHKRWKYV